MNLSLAALECLLEGPDETDWRHGGDREAATSESWDDDDCRVGLVVQGRDDMDFEEDGMGGSQMVDDPASCDHMWHPP